MPTLVWIGKRAVETPEERVQQQYLCILVNEYGFPLSQVAEEESVTGRGSAQVHADAEAMILGEKPAPKAPPKRRPPRTT